MLFLRLSAGLVQVADTIEVLDVCVGQKHTMHIYIVHSALWSAYTLHAMRVLILTHSVAAFDDGGWCRI